MAEEEDQEMLQVARAAHAERERLRLPVSSCPGAPPKAPPGRATAGERPGNRGGELTVVHFVPAGPGRGAWRTRDGTGPPVRGGFRVVRSARPATGHRGRQKRRGRRSRAAAFFAFAVVDCRGLGV